MFAISRQGFGMQVIAFDPYLTDEVAGQLRVERVELRELFSRADFISLHAASTPDTQNIINSYHESDSRNQC